MNAAPMPRYRPCMPYHATPTDQNHADALFLFVPLLLRGRELRATASHAELDHPCLGYYKVPICPAVRCGKGSGK
jgi:hypothetical protein